MAESQRRPSLGPLFTGLPADALDAVRAGATMHTLAAGQLICREGEPSDSLFVLCDGIARAFVTAPATGTATTVARLRPGAVIGEIGLVANLPRSANVVAQSDASVMEIGRDAFAGIVERYPQLLANLAHLLGTRLAQRNVDLRHHASGEVVVLVVEAQVTATAALVEATRRASLHSVTAVDLLPRLAGGPDPALGDAHHPSSIPELLEHLDELGATHGVVIVAVHYADERIAALLRHADRVLAVLRREPAAAFAATLQPLAQRADLVLLDGRPGEPVPGSEYRRARHSPSRLGATDVAWVGRHLARTKIGLALGAGGAKAFAHAAVIEVLEGAGYTIDCVSGSSMGAVVAVWLALGMSGPQIADTLRTRCAPPEVVEAIFRQGTTGTGAEVFTRIFRETTGDRSFADLPIPATVMTADLVGRCPAPLTTGPLWEALMAAVSIPGLYPPWVRGEQQLVDAVSLTPIPLDAIFDAGADIAIAVNLLGHELPSWPNVQTEVPRRTPRSPRDTVVQVLELAQLGASAREVVRADVPITPRFGPGTWRQMELEALFFAAGRAAAEAQLPLLGRLAPPSRRPT